MREHWTYPSWWYILDNSFLGLACYISSSQGEHFGLQESKTEQLCFVLCCVWEERMVIASAVTALAVATRPSPLLSLLTGQRVLKFKALCCSSEPSRRKLVLYSKPGCCLCDGLKEKLQAAFLLSGPDSLGNVDLQVSLSLSVIVSCMNMRFFFFDLMFWVFIIIR